MTAKGIIKVSGFAAGVNAVTLYSSTGEAISLDIESWKTSEILDALLVGMAEVRAKDPTAHPIVEINVDSYSVTQLVSEKSGGAITVVVDAEEKPIAVSIKGVSITENADSLAHHIDKAASSVQSAIALENFMKRFSKVQKTRAHTAKELLAFVKLNDLPISEDGRIIAFKILSKRGDGPYWFDKHSGVVPQRVGSLVMMPANAVDDSKRHECSTGFHVCSIPYIGTFMNSGDPLTITLVDPADIIAVPSSEPAKMRACSYFIAAGFAPGEAGAIHSLRQYRDIDSVVALIARVAAGDHSPVIETVFQDAKGKITITPAAGMPEASTTSPKAPSKTKAKKAHKKRLQAKAKPAIDTQSLKTKLDSALAGNSPQSREKTVDQAKALIENEGLSIKAAARRLGISDSHLGKTLKQQKWVPRGGFVEKAAMISAIASEKLALALRLIDEGQTASEASRVSGVARSTLRDHLKRTGGRKPAPELATQTPEANEASTATPATNGLPRPEGRPGL